MSAKPQQEALDFGRLYKVNDSVRGVYRFLNDAVDQVGIVTAAGACGIDRSDLRRNLDRDGRRVAVEHAMSIAAVCDSALGRRIAAAIVSPLDLSIADARPPMTDKERADMAEAVIRSLGPLAEDRLNVAYGGRR